MGWFLYDNGLRHERVSIKPVYFADSKPSFILSVNNVQQEFVENDFRNPDWYLYKILFLFKKILCFYNSWNK